MKTLTRCLLGAVAPTFLIGCGGGAANLPTATSNGLQSPQVRALNLASGTSSVSVEDTTYSSAIGTINPGQSTPYVSENQGGNLILFAGAGGTLATYNGNFAYSTLNTVALYAGSGQFAAFSLADNASPTPPGTSQIRVANAITVSITNVNVYLTPGGAAGQTLSSSNLISGNGLAFGSATGYKSVNPGTYTVTVTSAIDPSAILLNQVIGLSSASAITIYALNGSTAVTTTDNQ